MADRGYPSHSSLSRTSSCASEESFWSASPSEATNYTPLTPPAAHDPNNEYFAPRNRQGPTSLSAAQQSLAVGTNSLQQTDVASSTNAPNERVHTQKTPEEVSAAAFQWSDQREYFYTTHRHDFKSNPVCEQIDRFLCDSKWRDQERYA